jgi:hypothetical protein
MTELLKYFNNWEADEYYVGKRRVKNLSKVEINGHEFAVIARECTVPYNDMGHNYYAKSTHFFLAVMVGGVLLERDLNSLGTMKVYAKEWIAE